MVLFTILVVGVMLALIGVAIFLITGSLAIVLTFGDVIVCGLIIYGLIKWLVKRRSKK